MRRRERPRKEEEAPDRATSNRAFDADLYFEPRTNFWRFLRTFNILEPGRPVLSISKAFMWLSFFITASVYLGCLWAIFTVTAFTWEMFATVVVMVMGSTASSYQIFGNYRDRRESLYLQTKGYSKNFDMVTPPSAMGAYDNFGRGGGRRGRGFNPMSGYGQGSPVSIPPIPTIPDSPAPQTDREAEEERAASQHFGE